MEPPSLTFNIIDEDHKERGTQQAKEDDNNSSSSPTADFEKIEFNLKDFHDARDGTESPSPKSFKSFNPFKDTLANSEAIPMTQKLIEVEI